MTAATFIDAWSPDHSAVRPRQRGASLLGVLVVGLAIAGLAVMAARMVPALLEYQSAVKAIHLAADSASESEARATFERVAEVEGIHALQASDLRIERVASAGAAGGQRLVVAFDYRRDFPVAGPLALSLKFSGRAP